MMEPKELEPSMIPDLSSDTKSPLSSPASRPIVVPLTRFDWSRGPAHIATALRSLLTRGENAHIGCRKKIPGRLPSRVLRISSQKSHVNVRLHTSVDEKRGDYAALSYC